MRRPHGRYGFSTPAFCFVLRGNTKPLVGKKKGTSPSYEMPFPLTVECVLLKKQGLLYINKSSRLKAVKIQTARQPPGIKPDGLRP